LYAGGSHVNLGILGNKLDNSGTTHFGGNFGVDIVKTFSNGVELGASIDGSMFMVKNYQSMNDDAGELVDLLFRAGYNFNPLFNVPIALRGGIGYGVGQIGSNTMDGAVYDVEAEYDFNTKYGFGLKYKKANMTLTLPNDPKVDYSQIGCYLAIKF
jgi:hypothetical protein